MSTWRRLLIAATAGAVALGALGPTSASWSQTAPVDTIPVPDEPGQLQPDDVVVHSWALAPAGSADPTQPGNRPNLSYDLDPGAEVDDAVTLFNYSNVQLTFRVYATDAVNNDAGQFDLIPGEEEPVDVGTWISLPQENITVPAQSQATLPITVKVPADATAGDHVGAVVASSAAQGTGPDGKSVVLDRRTGSRVYIRVAGDLEPELAIESVHTTYRPALNPLDGTAEVTYEIRNRGNVRLGGRHHVAISGPLGLAEQRSAPEEVAELLPGESITVSTTFDGVPAAGVELTDVSLEPLVDGDGAGSDADHRRALTIAPPITLILLAAAVWLALRARRAYRRHRFDDLTVGAQTT